MFALSIYSIKPQMFILRTYNEGVENQIQLFKTAKDPLKQRLQYLIPSFACHFQREMRLAISACK